VLSDEAWVPLGEVMRPHGVRGEVRLRTFNRDSEVLLDAEEVLVRFPEGDEQEVSVDSARRANEAILLKLHSVDDRDRADELRGAMICVRRGSLPPLEDGEFYACDIEGARVVVREGEGEPREIGKIAELRAYPSVDVLVVEALDGGPPWEVPVVGAFVERVDAAGGIITLSTVEGIERG
jgi:16S rRNA processing protein RimM